MTMTSILDYELPSFTSGLFPCQPQLSNGPKVLILHTTEDLTYAQIAAKLGSTADDVRKVWGRAVVEPAKLLESPHESA
jgi:hypothetical protein